MEKILCTTSSFGKSAPYVLNKLESAGFDPVLNPYERKLNADELAELVQEHKPVGIMAGTEKIDSNLLGNAKSFLQVISRVGGGWDNVDKEAAQKYGIQVYRTEGVLDNSVAELTLGLILGALRNIPRQDREIRSQVWTKHMGNLLHGKTVGIIGFGVIGQRVGELCKDFGCRVVYSDLCPKECTWSECVSLDDLLQQADIVTLHADGSNCVLREEEIAKCKQGVIMVNTARGGLIHEGALYAALMSGQVGYACLDVFENEPYEGPLKELENMIMTAHIGSYAKEARVRMEELAVDNLFVGLGLEEEKR